MTQITSSAFSTSWPLTFARGRNGDVYGVNGENRGFRWDTVTANVEQLGISAPANAPALSATVGTPTYDVVGIEVKDGGAGYSTPPTLTLTGTGSQEPKAKADVKRGFCGTFKLQRHGRGYEQAPTVQCSAPDGTGGGSGATLSVTVSSNSHTLPGGATETRYRISSIAVTAGGSGYSGTPTVAISGEGPGGGAAQAVLGSDGSIASVRVLQSGSYTTSPTATIVADSSFEKRQCQASPVMRASLQGKYWAALRYIDDTTAAKGGPIPSSISEIATLELSSAAAGILWTWSNANMDARAHKIELWRTTSDQALVLYKVAEVARETTTYTDTLSDTALSDPTRAGFAALPITLPNGQANARRFTPPPQNKRAMTIFQDRAWFAVDVPGRTYSGGSDAAAAEPNAIYFSVADEPESVPETNQLIIQDNVKGQDRITALMPFGGGMVVFQERHCYRLTFVSQPLIDANITLIGQRGCLNQRCWDTYDNVAYVVDSMGMYMLDGAQTVPLSDPVETYWSSDLIHWPSSKWFFVRVDPVTRVARFFFAASAGYPDRALCFHPLTKAWWLEQYAQTFASAECLQTGGRQALLAGGQVGALLRFDSGHSDLDSTGSSVGIACSLRTGNMPFDPKEKDRAIRVLYAPTTATCSLSVGLHFNGSATARPDAIASDRGGGFVSTAGGAASLNLAATRSALGDATGYATCHYSGRVDDRSVGGDRHLAVAYSLTRPTTEDVTIYGTAIQGVGQ